MAHSSTADDTSTDAESSIQSDDSSNSQETVTLDADAYSEFTASLDPLLNHLYREGFAEQVQHLDELRETMEQRQEASLDSTSDM